MGGNIFKDKSRESKQDYLNILEKQKELITFKNLFQYN